MTRPRKKPVVELPPEPVVLVKNEVSAWQRYRKFIVAGTGAAIVTGLAALDQTGVLAPYPWISAGVTVVTAIGVRQVSNAPYTVPHPIEPPAASYQPPVLPPVTSDPNA